MNGNDLSAGTCDFNPLTKNPSAQVDFSGIKVPLHLTGELLSYFPRARSNQSIMLDLGCGEAIHRQVCERAGFRYLGADYASPQAQVLADAHCLPFPDRSFEFILAVALLEHIRYPFKAIKEIYRVMQDGAVLIGTAAFLEPFHSRSFYHHTHLGVLNLLQFAGFKIEHIAPSAQWSVFEAQALMHLFPKFPYQLSRVLFLPLYLLHRIYCAFLPLETPAKKEEILYNTGSFAFIARKTETKNA